MIKARTMAGSRSAARSSATSRCSCAVISP
jgi:hypothetical protein